LLTISRQILTFAPDGTPVSEAYGDVYHSAAGGHAQARHVFLAGNGLPARWRDRDSFTLLETGFGLGLNFLATWLAWRNDSRRCRTLRFVSLEKHPFAVADLAIAHAAWPEFSELSSLLRARWPALAAGEHRIELDDGKLVLRLVLGDAAETLPKLVDAVDAFYLDGFSPARNPDIWSPFICRNLARLAKPGATLATWSVAGSVRQALREAGFAVEKRPGFAGKRQMLAGWRVSEKNE
jgi:tRNA 5-methylaminomethyl-2-thiouridine biosynthesis bifunctional protein